MPEKPPPKKKGMQGSSRRVPREVIVRCIQRVHEGASMYSVAREIGKRTSAVKYWVDNAHRYLSLPEQAIKADGDLTEYHRQRFQGNGWATICHLLQESKRVSDPAFLSAIANYIDKVVPLLIKTSSPPDRDGPEGKRSAGSGQDHAVWQEVEVAVARLRRVRDDQDTSENQRIDQPKGGCAPGPGGPVIDAKPEKEQAKGANEASSDRT